MAHETVSELRVRYAETDQMGVVYHANYLVWCEIGRTDFIRALGKSYAEFEAEGLQLAVSDATLRYLSSARYDDSIIVRTRLTSLRSRALTFSYRILKAESNVTLVDASTTLVSLSGAGRMATLPPHLRGTMTAVLAPKFDDDQ